MTVRYSAFKQSTGYNTPYAGAIVGATFSLVTDKTIRYTGGISGFTVSQDIEQIQIETVGHRLPEDIVPGRYSGTASVNMFFSAKRGDEFVPTSSTFEKLQWNGYRFLTEGPFAGLPIDAIRTWGVARANIQQGARGVLTGEMSGPFIERLGGEEAARQFGQF